MSRVRPAFPLTPLPILVALGLAATAAGAARGDTLASDLSPPGLDLQRIPGDIRTMLTSGADIDATGVAQLMVFAATYGIGLRMDSLGDQVLGATNGVQYTAGHCSGIHPSLMSRSHDTTQNWRGLLQTGSSATTAQKFPFDPNAWVIQDNNDPTATYFGRSTSVVFGTGLDMQTGSVWQNIETFNVDGIQGFKRNRAPTIEEICGGNAACISEYKTGRMKLPAPTRPKAVQCLGAEITDPNIIDQLYATIGDHAEQKVAQAERDFKLGTVTTPLNSFEDLQIKDFDTGREMRDPPPDREYAYEKLNREFNELNERQLQSGEPHFQVDWSSEHNTITIGVRMGIE